MKVYNNILYLMPDFAVGFTAIFSSRLLLRLLLKNRNIHPVKICHFLLTVKKPFRQDTPHPPLEIKQLPRVSRTAKPLKKGAIALGSTLIFGLNWGVVVPEANAQTEAPLESPVIPLAPHEDSNFFDQQDPSDPELGILRLEELNIVPTTVAKPPVVYLITQASYLQSDNILLSARDPINDGLFRVSASVLAVPPLSDRTSVFASIGGSLARYSELTFFDYNQFLVNAGIRQRFLSETYAVLGWSHQQLFTKRGSNRFLDEHSLYGEINRRDYLSSQVIFDSFVQTRISFAQPAERSQFLNTAGVSFGYAPSSQFQAFLDYQFLYSEFTQQNRQDLYHQLTGRLVYRPSQNLRLEMFAGQSFGSSSFESIDFNGFVFGINLGVNVPLF